MCGILAALETGPARLGPDRLCRAVDSLSHRGPDRGVLLRRGPVSLGHTRLAIVDVLGGGQPLTSPDGALALVANGEIYNASEIEAEAAASGLRARTRSDCEAILLAYQLDPGGFLRRLKGMFAFVLVDHGRRRLVAARDRLGIKPLFIHRARDRLLLASEIKALLQLPGVGAHPDRTAIGEILTFGYPMGVRTPFEGVTALAPGHRLDCGFDAVEAEITRYWRPDAAILAGPRSTPAEAVERLGDAVGRAVRSHLMGEAPHLLYLSGGLDSSILAALLAEAAGPQGRERALSLHFAERRFDESGEARRLGDRLGLSLGVVGDRAWRLDDLAAAIRTLEQPQIVTLDLSMRSLSRAARDEGCKFVLAGDGADELLGGYDHFGLAKGRDFAAASVPAHARRGAVERVLSDRGYPPDFGRRYLAELDSSGWPAWDSDDPRALPWSPIWSANDALRRRLMPEGADNLGPGSAMAALWRSVAPQPDGLKPIQSYVCFELLSRLPNWILLKSDRNAMAHSIEVRVPFLDCDVIDAALACPPELVGSPCDEKLPLKRAFGPRLGAELTARRKRAFNVPHGWVFSEAAADLDEVLAPAALARTGLFDPAAVAAMRGDAARAYAGGEQPRALLPVLEGQTLLGVITTQLLFATDWGASPGGRGVEVIGAEAPARGRP